MTANYDINTIFTTLKSFGIDKKFIKEILLPDWWDDSIVKSKAGYLQTVDIISKNLGIDLASFIIDPATVNLKGNAQIKFKKAKNIEIDDTLIWPKSLALRMAELVEATIKVEFKLQQHSAIEIRKQMIDTYHKVKLETLLDYLWNNGIPVFHVSEFPKDVSKMDGMILNLTGRPIIVISKSRRHDAWLLFIIAHELGHFIKNHVTKVNNIIYDTDIEEELDKEEKEANEFALELLTGYSSPKFHLSENIDSSFKLLNQVNSVSKKTDIDPGVIVLNYAYLTKKWALAEQTLKNLDPKADAIGKIKDIIRNKLNFDNISEENAEFFLRITSLSEEGIASIS